MIITIGDLLDKVSLKIEKKPMNYSIYIFRRIMPPSSVTFSEIYIGYN